MSILDVGNAPKSFITGETQLRRAQLLSYAITTTQTKDTLGELKLLSSAIPDQLWLEEREFQYLIAIDLEAEKVD